MTECQQGILSVSLNSVLADGDIIQRNMNTKLKNILLCYASGMGIKSISSAFDISRNTVRRYVRMYQDSGIPAEKLPSLSDARLQELFAIPGGERTQTVRAADQA